MVVNVFLEPRIAVLVVRLLNTDELPSAENQPDLP